jgi:tetratricopeptide (TPR) repeat protein
MSKQKRSKPEVVNTPIISDKRENNWLPALLLAVLAFLLYANTLNHGYALDDYSVIKENYITKKGFAGISELMTTEYRKGYWNGAGTLYRPLSLVMFAIEWQFSPDKPFLSHFINVFLYATTAVVLFFLLKKILKNQANWLPFVITALFVAHPIHTEVVANIKSRDEILSFLLCLISANYFLQYFDNQRIVKLIIALFAFFLALLSKESAITFLAILPLMVYFSKEEVALSNNLKNTALFLIPTIVFLLLRSKVLGAQVGIDSVSPLDSAIAAYSGFDKFAAAICMAGIYLKSLLIPHPLVSDMGYNQVVINGFADWKVLLSGVAYGGLLFFAFKNIKEKNLISFGILLALIAFSISSNIFVTIGTGYGERLMYAPSLGFLIALVAFFDFLLKKINKNEDNTSHSFLPKGTLKYVTLAILAIFSIETIARNPVWKDSFSLYEADINTSPNCAKLNYHYALELTKKGRDDKNNAMMDNAIQHFEKAISIYPQYADAYGEMGLVYFYKGNQDKALEIYDKAIQMQPDAKVWSNMGMIFFNKGNMPEAQKVYEKAIALDPRFVDARRNLGSVYAMQGLFKDAIAQFQEALKYAPDQAILYFFLGSAYRDSGDAATGQKFLDKAYLIQPSLRK